MPLVKFHGNFMGSEWKPSVELKLLAFVMTSLRSEDVWMVKHHAYDDKVCITPVLKDERNCLTALTKRGSKEMHSLLIQTLVHSRYRFKQI